MATTATAPRPAEATYTVTLAQPPDWSPQETAAAIADLLTRLQDAAAMYRPGWDRLPAVTVRPVPGAGTP